MPLEMKLTLKLADVTYGELYDFVAAAKAAGVPAEEKVLCVGSDAEGDRFEVDLADRKPGSVARAAGAADAAPSRAGAHSIGGDGAGSEPPRAVADFLRRSLRSEADVDKVIGMLSDMRKFLR
ncbi:hypothetical protein [Dietzia timorensis]|uniref:Uncharacterized protein n=1 Tax=Dietzia timorensis TaxID=499555 RepID=A0A173LMZ8_9ACTN|nr:hypothetical protein [Dietzia timorensis]ANI92092.1 Hypothetical protein BJL86_1310 [Dietzia timorensis]